MGNYTEIGKDGEKNNKVLMDIQRRQESEESLIYDMTDDEFYDYREKLYGIQKTN